VIVFERWYFSARSNRCTIVSGVSCIKPFIAVPRVLVSTAADSLPLWPDGSLPR
jgi:hypothetical protein